MSEWCHNTAHSIERPTNSTTLANAIDLVPLAFFNHIGFFKKNYEQALLQTTTRQQQSITYLSVLYPQDVDKEVKRHQDRKAVSEDRC
jgi:hypothetical protein